MTGLVTDPQGVERLAEGREEENWAFRHWIKLEFGFDDDQPYPQHLHLSHRLQRRRGHEVYAACAS